MQQFVAGIIKDKLVKSAHDISEGGLAITLLESGFNRNLGFTVNSTTNLRKDAFWFGEAQSRVVVSYSRQQAEHLMHSAKTAGIVVAELGTVSVGVITVNGENWGNIAVWKEKYDTAIEKLLN